MKYLLTMTPDYVQDWDEWSGARELIQNVLDQSDINKETPIISWKDGLLTIGLPKCELSPDTLLLGKSSKRNDKTKRGQFGEGYKLALLVFARGLYDIKVRTAGEEWIASIVHSDEFNADVLQIERLPVDTPTDGVYFTVSKISENTWDMINSRYLRDVPNDTILKNHPRMIFSGGLFVREVKGLTFGYNFAPIRLQLGRDRDIVSGFDCSWHASDLWANVKTSELSELFQLMKSDAEDTRHVGYMPAKSAEIITKKYEAEYGEGTTPVLNQKQLDTARGQGLRAQIVPETLRTVIRRVKNFMYYDHTTPGYKMQQFFDKFEKKMNLDCREELKLLVAASKSWRS